MRNGLSDMLPCGKSVKEAVARLFFVQASRRGMAAMLACFFLLSHRTNAEFVAMNYGADGNDYFQFTNPSMTFDKASGFTTLITFAMHVDADGTLQLGGGPVCSNGVYIGPSNWGALVATLKTPPTTVTRYEVCIGGWTDTSFDNIKSIVAAQGVGPSSILYKNFQALKNAVPGIDAINDDDEQTYHLSSRTNFANMLGGLGYKYTLVPYTAQSFWVNLKNNITNCDYVYLQCYAGGAGNDPKNWTTAFGGSNGFSLTGFHVIPGQESNTANTNNWSKWFLQTGVQGGFYYPDIVFNTTNWAAAIRNGVGQFPPITLTNNDTTGSSFSSAGNWSDGKIPVVTNAYVDSGFVLNTPPSGQQNFSGGSLLLNNAASLLLKNSGSTTTFGTNPAAGLTVDYNASVIVGSANGSCTLAGYLNLGPDGGGNFVASNGVLNISAVINGSGQLNVPSGNSGVVVLAAANNFSGNTVVNTGSKLQLQNSQSLSASQLTLNTGSTLLLRSDNGTTFSGGDSLQGMGHASVTFDVDQLTASGAAQTLGFAAGGFNVGDTTLNFAGSHGYALSLGSLTGVYAGPLTLNATTANAYIPAVLGGANITQLVKNGGGTVSLTGASSYTGSTTVRAGVLEFQAGASGVSSQLQIASGATCRVLTALPVLAASAAVSITNGGKLYLAGSENLGVGSLVLNGVAQPNGSWGSSQSSAANQNDTYFGGSGILWVGTAPPSPGAPTGLNATPGNAQVTLNWTAVGGATSYNVKRSTNNGGPYTVITSVGSANMSYTDNGLNNGTNYYYVVSAVNIGGESPNSTQANATPEPVVTLTSSDTFGNSSFASAGHWSNGQTPSSANNYLVRDAITLRTPQNGGNATFLGNSLMLSNSTSGALLLKATSGSTITIGADPATGLFLDNGFISIVDNGRTESLAGFITLEDGGGIFSPYTGTLPITSQIRGPGFLKIIGNTNPASAQNGTVIISGVNTYTGGTILDTADTLRLSGSGTLGAITASFAFTDSSNLLSAEILDLNGTSQGVGNLSGISTARILNNAPSTTSTFTIGNGDNGGGNYSGVITNGAGTVALIKTGAGTITLTGSNTFTGAATINGGTLVLAGTGSINASKTISITQGATLDVVARNDQTLTIYGGNLLKGGGTINGKLNALAGATVSPGDSLIGTLTVQSNVFLSGSLLMGLNRAMTPSNDKLASVTGTIFGGGSLMISNAGPVLQAGDTFQLFNQPVSGFTAISLPAGYVWANNLSVDGTVRVNSVIATNSIPLSAQISGGSLLLQWPPDHTGWRLQAATNLLNPSWVDITNAAGTNQIFILNLSSNVSQFFRLAYP
jgi:autotransporter-associated beta strand protein